MGDTLNDGRNSTTSGARRRQSAPSSALKSIRLGLGMSQAELAASAGLSPGWVSLLERSPSFMSQRTLGLLARALGVPESELRQQPADNKGPS